MCIKFLVIFFVSCRGRTYTRIRKNIRFKESVSCVVNHCVEFVCGQGTLKAVSLKDLSRISAEELELVPSPATGTPGALTPPREFNLMFQTNVGAMAVSTNNQCAR